MAETAEYAEPKFVTVNEETATDPSIEQARAEVEQTRTEMSETIDALREALSPHHLVEEAKDAAYDATIGKATSALDTVKQGIGDAIESAKPVVTHTVDVVSETVTNAYESATTAIGNAVDVLSTATSAIGGVMGNAGNQVNNAVENSKDWIQNDAGTTAKGAGQMIMDTIKQNPLATTLIGLGIGLLVVNSRRHSSNEDTYQIVEVDVVEVDGLNGVNRNTPSYLSEADYNNSTVQPLANTQSSTSVGDRLNDATGKVANAAGQVQNKAGEVAHNVQQKAGELTNTVQQKAGELGNTVQQKAGELGNTVQSTAQNAWNGAGSTIQENPLAVGAVAVLLGAALGLALPRTAQENQVMGETRDKLKAQATDMMQETTHKVQTVAQEVLGTTVQTVKDKAQEQGLTA